MFPEESKLNRINMDTAFTLNIDKDSLDKQKTKISLLLKEQSDKS